MAAKKNSYISAELDFAEKCLAEWKTYLEENPINKIEDRWGKKDMPKGGHAWVVTANRETQIKCVQDTTAKYLQLLEVIDNLREKEESKQKEVRGGGEVPARMKR